MLISRETCFLQPCAIYEKDDGPSTHLFATRDEKLFDFQLFVDPMADAGLILVSYIIDSAQLSIPPYSHSLILPTTSHSLAIRRPIHREYLILMTRQVLRKLSSSDVPRFQCRILRSTDQESAVR